MKTTIIISLMAALLSMATSGFADVPELIPVQGVLTDPVTSEPIDGPVDAVFSIYDSSEPAGGNLLWSETYNSGSHQLQVVDGFFTAYLGEISAFDFGLFLNTPALWLGIEINGDGEMERIQLATVPFAVETQFCRELGDLNEEDALLISSLIDNPCPDGHYFQGWESGNALCQKDQVSSGGGGIESVQAGNGIAVTGDALNPVVSATVGSGLLLSENGIEVNYTDVSPAAHEHDIYMPAITCDPSYVIKYIGGQWQCALDEDTTYSAGTGLTLAGTTFSANLSEMDDRYAPISHSHSELQNRVTGTCTAGSSIRVINEDGTVTCEADDNTTYQAGMGLDYTAATSTFSVDPTDFMEPTQSTYENANDVALTGGLSATIASDSLTAPVPGTVFAIGMADMWYDNLSATNTSAAVRSTISTSSTADAGGTHHFYFSVYDNGQNYNSGQLSQMEVFSVNAGTTTFYWRAKLTSGDDGRAVRRKLTLLFIPN